MPSYVAVVLARGNCTVATRTVAPRAVASLVKKTSRNHVGAEGVHALLDAARATIALQEGTEGRRAEIRRLLARWELVREQVADVECRLGELVERTPAAKALLTVPGVSVVCAATLVAELGDPQWYEAPRQVLKLAGMNLARKESGTSVRGRVRQTKRGRPLLRRQLFLLAGRWCQTKGALPPLLRGAARPREAQDERRLRGGPQARPDATPGHADGGVVRPGALAGESTRWRRSACRLMTRGSVRQQEVSRA